MPGSRDEYWERRSSPLEKGIVPLRAALAAGVIVLISLILSGRVGRAQPAQQTATPLAGGTLMAQDTFAGRTVSGGWGAGWALKSGTASYLSVSGNEGREKGASSSGYENLTITSSNFTDVEAVARYTTASFKNDS